MSRQGEIKSILLLEKIPYKFIGYLKVLSIATIHEKKHSVQFFFSIDYIKRDILHISNWYKVLCVFIVPRNPNCSAGGPIVSNRTVRSIDLDFSQIESFTNSSAFCIKVQPKTKDKDKVNDGCAKIVNSTARIEKLETSTLYNFSVFTYVTESETSLLSASSCSLSVYTCKYYRYH